MNNNPRLPARATTLFHRPTVGSGPAVTVDILLTVTSVAIDGNTTGLVNDVIALTVSALMSNGETRVPQEIPGVTFTWASLNTSRATVDSSGNVTLVAAGDVDITCTAEGVTGTIRITISPSSPTLASILVSGTSSLVAPNDYQMTANGFDASGNDFPITPTWSSTNTAVVSINSSTGVASAVAPGSCQIRATDGAIVGRLDVSVVSPTPTLQSVAVSPSGSTIDTSSTLQMNIIGTYSNGSVTQIPSGDGTWEETGGGTISASGLYTAGGSPETATVRATVNGVVSPYVNITVVTPSAFPAAYDPARLGSDLILGHNWPNIAVGASIAEIIAGGGGFLCYRIGGGGGVSTANLVAEQVECVTNAAFGKTMRVRLPGPARYATMPANTEHRVSVAQGSAVPSFWFSAIIRWDGNGNLNGNPPSGGYPTAAYPNGYYSPYGTAATGSTTHKFMFSYPIGKSQRLEQAMLNAGYFNTYTPTYGGTEAGWLAPGTADNVNDVLVTGVNNWPYLNSNTLCKFRADREFYQMVNRVKRTSSSAYSIGYYWRRITSGEGTVINPSGWRFRGWDITGASNLIDWQYWQVIGNKSQRNDGPNDMFIELAAFEVVAGDTLAEPYATLDGFGAVS